MGATPFLLAAVTADVPLMHLLVELGADPLLGNADNATPLMAAAGVGTLAPTEEAGTEPEVLEAVQLALDLGGDVNGVDKNGETAVELLPVLNTRTLPAPNAAGRNGAAMYFRTHFTIASIANISLVFSNAIDDAAVFYLNGVRVRDLHMAATINSSSIAGHSTQTARSRRKRFQRTVISSPLRSH